MTSTTKLYDKFKTPAAGPGMYREWDYEYNGMIFTLYHNHPAEGNTEYVTKYAIGDWDFPWLNDMLQCYECRKKMDKKIVVEFKARYVKYKYEL